MMKRQFTIINETGFARPATLLVSLAHRFTCDIFLEHQGKTVNLKQAAKSIMDIMDLGIKPGTEIYIRSWSRRSEGYSGNKRAFNKKRLYTVINVQLSKQCPSVCFVFAGGLLISKSDTQYIVVAGLLSLIIELVLILRQNSFSDHAFIFLLVIIQPKMIYNMQPKIVPRAVNPWYYWIPKELSL
ncbi:HPr family phosphocarrier protein [Bacillus stercoris]|uniref:HPr family phosphocarrier protein n=1 Tax=Bacillus stercoris TaxID=2054641 RepID=UPI003D9BE099